MGVPKFFKWLTRRYPFILHNVKTEEDCPPIGNLYIIYLLIDNLYLDLNGRVHHCIHIGFVLNPAAICCRECGGS